MDRKLILSVVMGIAIVSGIYLIAAQTKPSPGHDWSQMVCDNSLCVNSVNGRVGIGTTNPLSKLTVAGIIESSTGGFKFPDGTMLTKAPSFQTTTASCSAAGGCYGGCTATCPAGYYVVGGGGSAMGQSYSQIQASYPDGNGWYCYGSVDQDAGCSLGTVSCYAVCAKIF